MSGWSITNGGPERAFVAPDMPDVQFVSGTPPGPQRDEKAARRRKEKAARKARRTNRRGTK